MRDFSPPTAPPSRTAHSTSFLQLRTPLASSPVGPLHPSLFVRNRCLRCSSSSSSSSLSPIQPFLRHTLASDSFSRSVANIRNVCRGHATGHQLHDLRFADLASRVHRHTGMRSPGAGAPPGPARVCSCTHAIHKGPRDRSEK